MIEYCGELLYAPKGPSEEYPYGLMVCMEPIGTEHTHDGSLRVQALTSGDTFQFDPEMETGRVDKRLFMALKNLENVLGCLIEEGRIEWCNDAPIVHGKLEDAQEIIEEIEGR